jgi:hypothetical protein
MRGFMNPVFPSVRDLKFRIVNKMSSKSNVTMS